MATRYYEALQSIFTSENKYTVLQLIKALIEATDELAGHTIVNAQISQTAATVGEPTTVTLKLSYDDNTSEDLSFVIQPGPRGLTGPQGEQGGQGVQGYQGIGISDINISRGTAYPDGTSYHIVITTYDPATEQYVNRSVTFIAPKGDKGDTGEAGVGVPTGGTAGQVLSKVDGTDYNTAWEDPASGGMDAVTITTINGTLSDADFAKLGNNCIVKYTIPALNTTYILTYVEETSSTILYTGNIIFKNNNYNVSTDIHILKVTKSTKAFTLESVTSYLLKGDTSALSNARLIYSIGLDDSNNIKKELTSHFRIPAGGSAGQVLSKVDGTDYNVEWATPSIVYCGDGSEYYRLNGHILVLANVTKLNNDFNVNTMSSSILFIADDNTGGTSEVSMNYGYYTREDQAQFAVESSKLIVFSNGIAIMHVKLVPYTS